MNRCRDIVLAEDPFGCGRRCYELLKDSLYCPHLVRPDNENIDIFSVIAKVHPLAVFLYFQDGMMDPVEFKKEVGNILKHKRCPRWIVLAAQQDPILENRWEEAGISEIFHIPCNVNYMMKYLMVQFCEWALEENMRPEQKLFGKTSLDLLRRGLANISDVELMYVIHDLAGTLHMTEESGYCVLADYVGALLRSGRRVGNIVSELVDVDSRIGISDGCSYKALQRAILNGLEKCDSETRRIFLGWDNPQLAITPKKFVIRFVDIIRTEFAINGGDPQLKYS